MMAPHETLTSVPVIVRVAVERVDRRGLGSGGMGFGLLGPFEVR